MLPTSITLYHYPLSRSARVKWLLHEILGEDFTTVKLDLLRGEGMAAEFLAKNPNHAVPVIDVVHADGREQTIIESGAILLWLAETYAGAGMAPPLDDPIARADYHQIMAFGSTSVDMMLWQIRLHRDLLPKPMRHAAQVELYMAKFKNEVEPQLTARLEQGPYMCGEPFTAADCLMGQNINWANAYGLARSDVFKAYMKRLKSRPAFQMAFADAAEFEA